MSSTAVYLNLKDEVVEVIVGPPVVALVSASRSSFFDNHRRPIVPGVHDPVARVPNIFHLAFALLRLDLKQDFSRGSVMPENNRFFDDLMVHDKSAVSRQANALPPIRVHSLEGDFQFF